MGDLKEIDDTGIVSLDDSRRVNLRESEEDGCSRIRQRVFEEDVDSHVVRTRVGLSIEELIEAVGILLGTFVGLWIVFILLRSIFMI